MSLIVSHIADRCHIIPQTRPDKRRNQELEDAEHSALVTVLLLLAALTIHSFFEGVVVGTLTAGADSLTLILALVSHKPLECPLTITLPPLPLFNLFPFSAFIGYHYDSW